MADASSGHGASGQRNPGEVASAWLTLVRHLQLLTDLNGRVRHAVQLPNPLHHRTLVGLRRYPLRNIPHGLAGTDPGQRGLSRNHGTGGLAHPARPADHS